jgi:hypothetical protein
MKLPVANMILKPGPWHFRFFCSGRLKRNALRF